MKAKKKPRYRAEYVFNRLARQNAEIDGGGEVGRDVAKVQREQRDTWSKRNPAPGNLWKRKNSKPSTGTVTV